MSGAESDEELPSINFQSLSQEIKREAMPTASEVAAQRERERLTAAELQRLRAPAAGPTDPSDPSDPPGRAERAERAASSSGSEGEASLAAAVRRLRVLPPPAPRRSPGRRAARRLLRLLPPAARRALRRLAAALDDRAPDAALRALSDQISRGLSAASLCAENARSEDEAVWSAAAACACAWAAGGPAPRRALLRLLARAGEAVVRRLRVLLLEAADTPHALLQLGGPLRALPPAAPARSLHAALVRRGLALLLLPPAPPAPPLHDEGEIESISLGTLERLLIERKATPLDARSRRLALQLAARAARDAADVRLATRGTQGTQGTLTEDAHAAPRLLAALAQPPRHKDKHHPDCLKLAATSSTLQLIFRATPAPAHSPHVHIH